MSKLPKSWIACQKPVRSPRVRLFCFPHAGGNVTAFRDWADELPNDVEVCALQLSGRGTRALEPPPVSITQIVDAVVVAFDRYKETPVALLGHSFGALIAFEFARRLRAMNIRPVRFFVSSRSAPQLRYRQPPLRDLPTPEFVAAIRARYQGIPDEILNCPEMVEFVLPPLRLDITLNETYQYLEEPPLDFPVSSFGGLQDLSATQEELTAWEHQTTRSFKLTQFPGGHFFIHNERKDFLRAVAEDLNGSLREFS